MADIKDPSLRVNGVRMADHGQAIESLRDRIETSDEISDGDREALLHFSDEIFLRKHTDARHEKLLRHCTIIAEKVGGLAASLKQKPPAKDIVRWINRTYENEETNRDYRVAFRVFGRFATDKEGDDPPATIDWVQSGTSSSYDPSPDPRDMLHWDEHVIPMIESCYNVRDKAMIAVAFDAGPRSGEFKGLTIGDVQDHDHGLQITVEGKQGRRTVTLIPSVPYLNQWRSNHPRTNDRDAPLWCNLTDGTSISDKATLKVFHEAAYRADVNRPSTITNFRKSSASYLASKGMSQSHLEQHHGWKRGSRHAARYIAVFGDAADNELARIHGIDVEEDEAEDIGPVLCPRCERETPRDKAFCVWCDQAIDAEAAAKADEVDDDIFQSGVVAASDEEIEIRAEDVARLRTLVNEEPALRRLFIDD